MKNLNVDPGAKGNGSSMTNSMGLNLKSFAPRLSMNEVAVNRPTPAISPDFVFPPGGIPSLHLPSVVVLVLCLKKLFNYCDLYVHFSKCFRCCILMYFWRILLIILKLHNSN